MISSRPSRLAAAEDGAPVVTAGAINGGDDRGGVVVGVLAATGAAEAAAISVTVADRYAGRSHVSDRPTRPARWQYLTRCTPDDI